MTREAASAGEMWQWLCALAGFQAPAGAGSDAVVSVRSGEGVPAQVSPGEHADAAIVSRGPGAVLARRALGTAALELFERYAPLCATGRPGFVVAHLGQSLDGRIGPLSGEPEAITGPEDMAHNHRMRALFDVVLVGAGTVCHDDPQLTVRHVEGKNPVRVVLDPERRLSSKYLLFNDGLAPTLLLCRAQRCQPGERHGQAEVVGVAGECSPAALHLQRSATERTQVGGLSAVSPMGPCCGTVVAPCGTTGASREGASSSPWTARLRAARRPSPLWRASGWVRCPRNVRAGLSAVAAFWPT